MRDTLLDDRSVNLVKGPNALMNDYTKNISESIFSPGVYKVDKAIEKMQKDYAKTHGRNPDG